MMKVPTRVQARLIATPYTYFVLTSTLYTTLYELYTTAAHHSYPADMYHTRSLLKYRPAMESRLPS